MYKLRTHGPFGTHAAIGDCPLLRLAMTRAYIRRKTAHHRGTTRRDRCLSDVFDGAMTGGVTGI